MDSWKDRLFRSDSNFLQEEIQNSLNETSLLDIRSFQIGLTVTNGLQQEYTDWLKNNEQTNGETDITHHSLLKDECRATLKKAISTFLTGKDPGALTVEFDPDSPLKISITLGCLPAREDDCRKRQNKRNKIDKKDESVAELNCGNDSLRDNHKWIHVSAQYDPVVLEGRYLKYQRNISQTRWFAAGEDSQVVTSVEEAIGSPLSVFWKAEEYSFHAAGREDVDVRMLGSGRPCVIILKNPKMLIPRGSLGEIISIETVMENVNRITNPIGVELRNLQIAQKHACRDVHYLGEEKCKEYACVCELVERNLVEDEVNNFNKKYSSLHIVQKTPIRVAHRRTLASRTRFISHISTTYLSPRLFAMRLTTEAGGLSQKLSKILFVPFLVILMSDALRVLGTYIKEFVHGDFGRTQPSMSSLLNTPVNLIQLDVINLKLGDKESKLEDEEREQNDPHNDETP